MLLCRASHAVDAPSMRRRSLHRTRPPRLFDLGPTPADPRGPARTPSDPRGPARTRADPCGPARTSADPRGPPRRPLRGSPRTSADLCGLG
eukprot:1088160-Prymnesium_polylepis.1